MNKIPSNVIMTCACGKTGEELDKHMDKSIQKNSNLPIEGSNLYNLDHICRFHDFPQRCTCYQEGVKHAFALMEKYDDPQEENYYMDDVRADIKKLLE